MENNSKKRKAGTVVSFLPSGEYYYQKAIQALNHEQYDKAYKYSRRAAELSPEDPMILLQYAIIQMENGHFEESLELLIQAYQFDQTEPEIVFFLSELNAQLGFLSEARKYANEYLQLDPTGAYFEEAQDILDFTDFAHFEESEEEFEQSESTYQQERARQLMEKGKFDEAIELLEKVIEEQPDFWSAYNNLSLAYFYVGEVEQAKALIHTVLRQNSGNLHAICNLAVIHYYEKNDEELHYLLEVLRKIQPMSYEHRYKLGATFALIGQYEPAFKWLRSLQKKGYDGDPGFFFWLSHAAYFSGHEKIAKSSWDRLLQLDPEKEGLEPWHGQVKGKPLRGLENDREFLTQKLENTYRSERMIGLFLLGKTAHKQEILAHPEWLKIDQYSEMEKWLVAYSLGHRFEKLTKEDRAFLRAMDATEMLYVRLAPIEDAASHLFQMWFGLMERALEMKYEFKNTKALAAAAEFMFRSTREKKTTKKEVADVYGITSQTLTKYVNELMQFLPIYES